MNYIKLLNAAFEKFYFDDRLHPTHISLYMALFQEWNCCRFSEVIMVSRKNLMIASKIGSTSSYHRCIKDLEKWNYLFYSPSKSPYKGSKIKMSIIKSDDNLISKPHNPIGEHVAGQYSPRNEPTMGQYNPILEQLAEHYSPTRELKMVSNINNTKQVNNIKQPKGCQAVINFFNEKGFNADEGKKFFEHYEPRDWKTSDGKNIRDWRGLAMNWMDRTELFGEENIPSKKEVFQPDRYSGRDNLRTTKNKDYGQPL